MKHFLAKFLIALIPVILLLTYYELGMRVCDNDYKYKNKWLSENASKVEVLSLGSSHGYYGIDPTQFSLHTFNAGHVSQDIHYDYFIFDKFIEKMDSLKYLILPISSFSLWSDLEKGSEAWRVKYYCMYYHCPYHPCNPKYHLEIADGIHINKIARDGNNGLRKTKYCSELGQGTLFSLSNREEGWESRGKEATNRHSYSDEELNNNDCSLNKSRIIEIVSRCEKKGIKVILLTTPAYETYRDNLNPLQLTRTFDFCDELQKQNSNVVYFNMLSDPRFDEGDFFDSDHLNELGAIKLSNILNEYIMDDIRYK